MHRGRKYIDAGKHRINNNSMYGLSMTELYGLIDTANNEDIIRAIANAFYMGVEAGARMTEGRCKA